ncbi:MAG TPA: hypothetical protein ENI79_00775 [Rhodospirillales bacterium]|nr:hypothetical protein [Rhodospirillales bacterium]
MRTIFLLTILTTLLVIVTKKPEQTLWEAAQGLWGKVETTASEVAKAPPVPPMTGNAREDFAALRKRVRRALGTGKGPGAPMYGSSQATGSKSGTERDGPAANPVLSSPMVSSKAKPDTVRNAEMPASSPGGVKVMPRSRITDIPELPAIPVTPVEVGKIGESAPLPSLSRPRQAVSPSFSEVKAYYENASRLLAEIK